MTAIRSMSIVQAQVLARSVAGSVLRTNGIKFHGEHATSTARVADLGAVAASIALEIVGAFTDESSDRDRNRVGVLARQDTLGSLGVADESSATAVLRTERINDAVKRAALHALINAGCLEDAEALAYMAKSNAGN